MAPTSPGVCIQCINIRAATSSGVYIMYYNILEELNEYIIKVRAAAAQAKPRVKEFNAELDFCVWYVYIYAEFIRLKLTHT